MNFYYIVVITACIILLLLLSFIGVITNKDRTNAAFPPNFSVCPDYWKDDGNGNCIMPTAYSWNDSTTFLNAGDGKLLANSSAAPYSADGKSFNPTDPLWSSKGASSVCAQKDWAVKHNIVWDGISNYNQC